jgi:hypothetical protein
MRSQNADLHDRERRVTDRLRRQGHITLKKHIDDLLATDQ